MTMKIRPVSWQGGEGSRLGVFYRQACKTQYLSLGNNRIIDFTLSNCVNSGIFDVTIVAQYLPIAH